MIVLYSLCLQIIPGLAGAQRHPTLAVLLSNVCKRIDRDGQCYQVGRVSRTKRQHSYSTEYAWIKY